MIESILDSAPWLIVVAALLGGIAILVGRATSRPGPAQPHRRDLSPPPDHTDAREVVDEIRARGEARRSEIAESVEPDASVSPADVWNRRHGR